MGETPHETPAVSVTAIVRGAISQTNRRIEARAAAEASEVGKRVPTPDPAEDEAVDLGL
jgi:hypothetical protein